MPVAPQDAEDKIANQILKFSAKEPEEKYVLDFKEDEFSDVKLVLVGIQMEKYIDLFVKSKITLVTFLQLGESDLREIGITDSKDLEIILKNIQSYEATRRKLSVPVSSHHDLQIARNVRNEMVLLQNYCSYLELQMRKHKLTDYRLNWRESASTYLRAFANTAYVQTKIMSQRVFHTSGSHHLIGKALKLSNLPMTETMKEKLKKKTPKIKQRAVCVAVILGILSVAVLVKFFHSD